MRLAMRVFTNVTEGSECRVADPPFEISNAVELTEDGEILVFLSEEDIYLLRDDLELDDQDWFDGIQWTVSLDQLAADFIEAFRRRGELAVDRAEQPAILAVAAQLERAAAMLRSVEFFDRAAWDAQFGPGQWHPYPRRTRPDDTMRRSE